MKDLTKDSMIDLIRKFNSYIKIAEDFETDSVHVQSYLNGKLEAYRNVVEQMEFQISLTD